MKRLAPMYPGILLFLFALAIGLFVYQDYGISWDEQAQRDIGTLNYDYVFKNDPSLLTSHDREYGPAFEMPLIFIEKWMHLTDTRDVFLMRHIAAHTFFLISIFCTYILIYRLFKNQFLACLGFIMIAIMPRIYAHSFFNTKDVPFLAALLICVTICQAAFEKKKPFLFLFLGIACGYSSGIRLMGLLPSLIILFFVFIDSIHSIVIKEKPGKQIAGLCLFAAGFIICLYAVSPYLWSNPLHNFAACCARLFRKDSCGYDLLNGKYEFSGKLPWFYLPEWFGITVPVLWLISGISGMIWLVVDMLRKPVDYLANTTRRNFLIYFLCFVVPVFSVIVFHSIIYDEWRHLYFIYPFFVLIALFFIDKLIGYNLKIVVQLACLIQIIFLGGFMIKNHPFQQVYFNSLVSHDNEYLRKHFEFDYWGSSAKQALDYLVAAHPAGTLKVINPIFGNCVTNNRMLLKQPDRDRIQVTEPEQCDYYITNFRVDYSEYSNWKTEYERKVLNSTIVRVYKISH